MSRSTLPKHPRTGFRALGWRKARPGEDGEQPIWPIAGGAPDDKPDDDDDQGGDDKDATDDSDDSDKPDDDDDDSDDDTPLGPKGEKALAAEKEKRRKEAERRRSAEKKTADLTAELAKLRKAPASATDDSDDSDKPDPEEIRKEIQAELRAEQARERVRDKIEVKAAKQFADPGDAVALVLSDHDIDDFLDDGKPDIEAIQEALSELLESKPYLGAAAQGGDKKNRFKGNADGGAKPAKPARPKSLDEAVRNRLSPTN